jgi:hypothetical protein
VSKPVWTTWRVENFWLPGLELRLLRRPALNQSLYRPYRLRYPDVQEPTLQTKNSLVKGVPSLAIESQILFSIMNVKNCFYPEESHIIENFRYVDNILIIYNTCTSNIVIC